VADGVDHRLGAVAQVRLAEDVVGVGLDRGLGDEGDVGVAVAALGLALGLLPARLALLFGGLAATGTMTLLNAGLQVAVPDAVRGRVLSLYTLVAAEMPALDGWLLGMALAGVSPPIVFVLAGGLLRVLALLLGHQKIAGPHV